MPPVELPDNLYREVRLHATYALNVACENLGTLGDLIDKLAKQQIIITVLEEMDDRDQMDAAQEVVENTRCRDLRHYMSVFKRTERSIPELINNMARELVIVKVRKTLAQWATEINMVIQPIDGITLDSRIAHYDPMSMAAPAGITEIRIRTPEQTTGSLYTYREEGDQYRWINIKREDGATVIWDLWIQLGS